MGPIIDSLIAGLPVLLLHFGATVLGFVVWLGIYMRITPYHELTLIRQGNVAAAIALGGAALSIALPLAVCMAKSVNLYDIFAWGTIAVVIQLAALGGINLVLKEIKPAIERGEIAIAIVLASIQLSIATINAAAVSG